MALLEIKKFPHQVLRELTKPVRDLNGACQKLIDDMIETMYAAPGVGLAAPQVGVSESLVIIDPGKADESVGLVVLINPEIVETDGIVESEEGCLSFPGLIGKFERAERVVVKGFDRNGKEIFMEGKGLLGIALQHEIDHLKGKLIIDRVGMIKRELYKKRIRKEALKNN